MEAEVSEAEKVEVESTEAPAQRERAEMEEMQARIESMDKSLYNGLRGLVMLVDLMETAVNPTSEPEEKAASLMKVRQIIDMMQRSLT